MKRNIRTFPMPKGCDAATVTMRSMDKADELAAAVQTDIRMRTLPADQQRSARLANDIERDESIRQAIRKIDGKPVNRNGVPCLAIDKWSQKSWTALYTFHGELNGIPGDELGNCVKAGVEEEDDESDGPAPSLPAAGAGK